MILMVTADLAGVDVERDHRRRIEIVAGVHVARPRRRIARAPEAQVELRIVVPREPHGDAARLPGVTLPGLVTGLSGPRDRVGLPRGLAVFRVEGGDVAADAELAARGADHDLALRDQRRQGEVVTVLVVVDGRVPHHLAGLGIERDHVGIDGADVHAVLPERHAPVGGMELEQVLRQILLVAPEQVARLGVEREDLLLRGRHEHDAVVDDRWRLVALGHAGRERPDRHELLDVRRGDPVEGTVPPAAIVAPVHQPIVRLRVEEPLLGHRAVLAHALLRREHRRPERRDHRDAHGGQLPGGHHPRLLVLACRPGRFNRVA